MSWASSEVVNVLTFLLPGFVTAFVFHSLTSHPRLKEFDRVVQALIFTILIQAIGEAILGIGTPIQSGLSMVRKPGSPRLSVNCNSFRDHLRIRLKQ